MKDAAFLIAATFEGWALARAAGREALEVRHVKASDPKAPWADATVLAGELRAMGGGKRGLCLGLPSPLVIAAPVRCDALPRKGRRQALLYRLEEQVPLAAEQLTVDFLPPEGGLALALAVETQRIQALLDCLGEAGIEVANISPTSLLALGQYLSDHPPQARYLILPGPGGTDIFRMGHKHRPVAWFTAAPGAAAPLECLRADILASSLPQDAATVALLGEAPAELASAIAAEPGLTLVQGNDVPAFAAAARAAGDLIAGRPTGWVDLRRDKLEPPGAWKALTRLVSSAAILSLLLLAAVAACFHWRVKAYDALAARADQSQRDEYARLYPGRRVPVNAKIALASELKRLTGLQGADADSPRQSDALEALRTISAALPTTIRYRIVELRINPDDFLIEGQALDHTGAEVVAQGLVRAGYAVEPPRTEHLARGGVGFTLMAKSAPPKPAPGAAGGVK